MDHPIPVPLLTADLVRRLVVAERTCYADWVRAMADEPGNPLGAEVRAFGQATALVCAAIPAQVWNRVFGWTSADLDRVPPILDFYRERGAEPLFDVVPTVVPPFWEGPNALLALAQHGFYQGAFHQLLFGAPAVEGSPPPARVAVAEVGRADADAFVRVYEQVWGDGAAIRVLLGRPRFRCYIATVDGEPAALGVLHVADGVGSMANGLTAPPFRGQGCHRALLARRVRDAAVDGCDLLVSQCSPGSVSERNQFRLGFRVAATKAWWVPRPITAG